MRKEVTLAIIIGLILGLIITYGVYTANQATTPKNNLASGDNTSATPAASVTPSPDTLFTLVSPTDGDIVDQNFATISGKLKVGSQMIVLSESEDLVVTPNTDGTFIQTVKLVTGANLIQITAVNGDIRQDQLLNIVYSTTKYE